MGVLCKKTLHGRNLFVIGSTVGGVYCGWVSWLGRVGSKIRYAPGTAMLDGGWCRVQRIVHFLTPLGMYLLVL
jgi:hypothetical protein